MFRDKDFDINAEPCFNKDVLNADLELETVIGAMAGDDKIIRASCICALFSPLTDEDAIRYRQQIVRDALRNPDVVRKMYAVTVETEKRRRDSWCWVSTRAPLSSNYTHAIEFLRLYMDMLMQLRSASENRLSDFHSEGFINLFTMFQNELSDEYFAEVHSHLDALKENDGILISAEPGNYLQGVDYVLRRKKRKGFWRRWYFAPSFSLAPRDDAGAIDLEKRRERAINDITNALAQSAEHLSGFFDMLRRELAFYVGCINLADKLHGIGMPLCIPDISPASSRSRSWDGLYDISLALIKNSAVTGNTFKADNRLLYLITGANQGGKSTFLRSIGQSQLMAQSGMFVCASAFSVPIRNGIFSHFKKEEDTALKSGKLDEELSRMDEIADRLEKDSLMLFNESFAATNEREGSEICRQITKALIENGVEVFSVTHLYTYAVSFRGSSAAQFLRAQRLENGERTFRLVPGEPMQTAFGEDIYRKIFGKTDSCKTDTGADNETGTGADTGANTRTDAGKSALPAQKR